MITTVRDCPGSGANADIYNGRDWCRSCGRLYQVRMDGTLRRHPMDYARMVTYAAEVVRDLEFRTGYHWPRGAR